MVRLVRSSLAPAYSLLGRAVAVELPGGVLKVRASWLAADPRGGALLIGPDRAAFLSSGGNPEAVYLRERFTGHEAHGIAWAFDPPEEWDELGEPVAILYESDKSNGGGTGKTELFRHEFHPGGAALAAGEWIAILGQHIRVDASGVRN